MFIIGKIPSYLFVLIIGVVVGVYGCSLFQGCGQQRIPVSTAVLVKAENIQKQAAVLHAQYQGKIDSLGITAQKLASDLQHTQSNLRIAKQKNRVLQTQVYDLLDQTSSGVSDTVLRIADCDSLQGKVKELLISGQAKDSLYEEVVTNQENQLKNKDSTLLTQQEDYAGLKSSFSEVVQQQKSLQAENARLHTMIHRHKVGNTFKTIGLVIAAALGAHLLSHL